MKRVLQFLTEYIDKNELERRTSHEEAPRDKIPT